MCETVEPTADPTASPDLGQLYQGARDEAVLATDLLALGLPDSITAWSCAIQAHRDGQLATYVLGSTAPELVTEMQAVITACAS